MIAEKQVDNGEGLGYLSDLAKGSLVLIKRVFVLRQLEVKR